jgi:hypothetical protein
MTPEDDALIDGLTKLHDEIRAQTARCCSRMIFVQDPNATAMLLLKAAGRIDRLGREAAALKVSAEADDAIFDKFNPV